MKLLRRGTALILSLALLLSLVAVVATPNWTNTTSLGLLSRYYETGSTDSDPGIISTVPGDPGGKSYGVYMFASNPGTVMDFIEWCLSRDSSGAAYGIGERLLAAYNIDGYGSIFDEAWEYEADRDSGAFLSAQEGFVGTEIYDAALDNLREVRGIILPADYYSTALKNVIWSRAVHHGPEGAGYMIKRAFDTAFGVGGYAYQSEGDLIEAIYEESGRVVTYDELVAELTANGSKNIPDKDEVDTMSGSLAAKYGVSGKILRYWYGSSGAVQLSVYRRLNVYEVGDALTLLKNNAMPEDNQPAPGNYNISLQTAQQLYMQSVLVDSTVSPALSTENAGKFTLEYLAGADAYTISTVVDNKTWRLSADKNGVVMLATPDDTDRQLWQIVQDGNNGYTVRNEYAVYSAATSPESNIPTYLSYQDNILKLVAPADAIPATEETPAVAAVVPSTWLFTAVTADNSDWTLRWVIAPQTNLNTINEGDSAFPVRGLISCSSPISSVSLTILDADGDAVDYASETLTLPKGTYAFDLKDMDSYISYSKLEVGSYTYVLSATTGTGTFDNLLSSSFTVGVAGTVAPPVIIVPPTVEEEELPELPPVEDSESVVVAFLVGDHGNCATTSKTYSLDDITYGELPTVQADTGWRFVGWFTAPNGEGEEVLPGSQIPAASMAVYAHYTKINSYKFLNAAGKTFNHAGSTGFAAPGELIEKPSEAPIKNPDNTYTYTFSHWVDAAGNKYGANTAIVMGQSDMEFTPVYTAIKKPAVTPDPTPDTPSGGGDGGSGGNTTTTTPSGSTWPITLGTSVSQISGTVYSNGKAITSGVLATGMTATVDGKEYVITVTGDPSGDGKISVTDVVKLQSHLLNKSSLTGAYLDAGDLNGDGKVTITDLVKAAHVVAGKSKIG